MPCYLFTVKVQRLVFRYPAWLRPMTATKLCFHADLHYTYLGQTYREPDRAGCNQLLVQHYNSPWIRLAKILSNGYAIAVPAHVSYWKITINSLVPYLAYLRLSLNCKVFRQSKTLTHWNIRLHQCRNTLHYSSKLRKPFRINRMFVKNSDNPIRIDK